MSESFSFGRLHTYFTPWPPNPEDELQERRRMPQRENDSIELIRTTPANGRGELCGDVRGKTVLALVSHARQRLFKNELLSQGANAFCAALLAFILLLLVGTQVLDWRLTLLIPLGAAAVGVYL